jgi:hypothetical protein
MQFGIGLLGKGWTIEKATEAVLANTFAPHRNFHLHASRYAGKIAKETILSEHPTMPDLTDEGIVQQLAGCARPVRPSEAGMVREAFNAEYDDWPQSIDQTCCGKCTGSGCYVDFMTGERE